MEITARVGPGGGSEVAVTSKSRFPLTLLDYGKNKNNVEAAFRYLDKVFARADTGVSPSGLDKAKNPTDPKEELQRLASLRKEGLLTADEFEEKRKAIADTL